MHLSRCVCACVPVLGCLVYSVCMNGGDYFSVKGCVCGVAGCILVPLGVWMCDLGMQERVSMVQYMWAYVCVSGAVTVCVQTQSTAVQRLPGN